MDHELIAMVAHEVNRAYCLSIGDDSHPKWADAPQWQRDSAVAGVKFRADNPDATPEDMHDSWTRQKVADGWSYGEIKDADAKTHPCMVEYSKLPIEQRTKDYLFSAVFDALK